jgi:hypothetical protein
MNRFVPILVAMLAATSLFAQTLSERILLPIFTPPVHGAFGSEFHTDLRVRNYGEHEVLLAGISGTLWVPICLPVNFAYILNAGEELEPGAVSMNGSPGRFLFVTKDQLGDLSMQLRVHDVTRGALNFGTEIPIVRESEFRSNDIVLLGIPTDSRFRNTLRIYSDTAVHVLVTVGEQEPVRLKLVGGIEFPFPTISIPDFYTPAYVAFSDFPNGTAPVRVTVRADPDFLTLIPLETSLWAFVTVTNNDTQVISTITPQP